MSIRKEIIVLNSGLSTSRDTSSQPEIKFKDAKLSEKTQRLKPIKMQYCCTSSIERRLENIKGLETAFKDEKEKLDKMLGTIPPGLATSFKTKIDSLTAEFQESSKRYESQSGARSKIIRDLNERNMQLTYESLQKMRKELEKDLGLLNSLQEAITEHEQALKSVRQDDQALVREWADTQIESAMKKYSLAHQSRDPQGYERLEAKKQIEETSRRLQESSKALHLRKMQHQLEEIRVDEIQARIKNAPVSIKDLFNKAIDAVSNAYQDVLACLQDGWPLRGEDIGDALRKGADQRFQKAYDRLKTLSEASLACQEALKEHDEALKNYVPQEYHPLVKKLVEKQVELAIADCRAVLQRDQQGPDRSHAIKEIEEITLQLQERSEHYKKPIQDLIRKIDSALYDGLIPEGRVIHVLQGIFIHELDQFDKVYNGETKSPTCRPEQWIQEIKGTYAEIVRVRDCYQRYHEMSYEDFSMQLLNLPPKLPITDKWEKCCISHDNLVICIGDVFKSIDPEIHKDMEVYKKAIEDYKKKKEKLDEYLGDLKFLLTKARRLESNAGAREFIASIENRSKSTLAKSEQLIAKMEVEHEDFKEYLRNRGWLERK